MATTGLRCISFLGLRALSTLLSSDISVWLQCDVCASQLSCYSKLCSSRTTQRSWHGSRVVDHRYNISTSSILVCLCYLNNAELSLGATAHHSRHLTGRRTLKHAWHRIEERVKQCLQLWLQHLRSRTDILIVLGPATRRMLRVK